MPGTHTGDKSSVSQVGSLVCCEDPLSLLKFHVFVSFDIGNAMS